MQFPEAPAREWPTGPQHPTELPGLKPPRQPRTSPLAALRVCSRKRAEPNCTAVMGAMLVALICAFAAGAALMPQPNPGIFGEL